MTLPLVVLGFLSVVGGVINLPFGNLAFLERWLEPVLQGFAPEINVPTSTKVALAVVTTVVCVIGILFARQVWSRSANQPQLEPEILRRGWGVDQLYSLVFGRGGEEVADGAAAVDKDVIDGAVNGVAGLVRGTGGVVRRLQTGYVRNYALGITAGTVLILGWAAYLRVAG
jgi:NADH-quinone oxidoreductase subunit L